MLVVVWGASFWGSSCLHLEIPLKNALNGKFSPTNEGPVSGEVSPGTWQALGKAGRQPTFSPTPVAPRTQPQYYVTLTAVEDLTMNSDPPSEHWRGTGRTASESKTDKCRTVQFVCNAPRRNWVSPETPSFSTTPHLLTTASLLSTRWQHPGK